MAQRFNPPPGWQVPANFVPTADWQPDPSWPPAPEGWTYWVDDGAGVTDVTGATDAPAQPADASVPPYGTPAATGGQPPYGAQPTTSFGQASAPSPYGAPAPGAYGSTDAGSAAAAMAERRLSAATKQMWIGLGLIALCLGITIVTFAMADIGDRFYFPWYLGVVGLIFTIRAAVDRGKAKKALGPSGFTPPGMTPPGQNPPGV